MIMENNCSVGDQNQVKHAETIYSPILISFSDPTVDNSLFDLLHYHQQLLQLLVNVKEKMRKL